MAIRIVTARTLNMCSQCGTVIEPGDKMGFVDTGPFAVGPGCIDCVELREKRRVKSRQEGR